MGVRYRILFQIHSGIIANAPLAAIFPLAMQFHFHLDAEAARVLVTVVSLCGTLASGFLLFLFLVRSRSVRGTSAQHRGPERRLGRGGIDRGIVVDELGSGLLGSLLHNGGDVDERGRVGFAVKGGVILGGCLWASVALNLDQLGIAIPLASSGPLAPAIRSTAAIVPLEGKLA